MSDGPTDPAAAGQPPLVAALELGGTKCIAALVRGPEIVRLFQMPTGDRPAETLATLLGSLEQWRAGQPFAGIGIGSFGPLALDPSQPGYGRLLQTPKPGWSGFDVRGAVAARFALPIGFDTDVAGAALAEGRWGAARGCASHAYLTFGTGVGLGLVSAGRVHHGALHPEGGHVPVRRAAGDTFAGVCPFHGDCLEGLVGGPAIAARAGRASSAIPDDDPLWPRMAGEIADLMATLVLIVAPQRIVLGGGVIERRPHLVPAIRTATARYLAGYVPGRDRAGLDDVIVPAALEHAG
ncbi:MAG: ROK family protein, partial [Novosphingobium sp.]